MGHQEEKNKDLLQWLHEDIMARNDLRLVKRLSEVHYADIAEILKDLEGEELIYLFELLNTEVATRVLEESDQETFHELMVGITREQKIEILEEMSQDDIADKLNDLPAPLKKELLSLLDRESAEDVQELMVYPEDTAGGIMTKDYVALEKDMTIYKAIETLREIAPDAETIYYVYVQDSQERLVGVISLRQLIIAKPNSLVEDVMIDRIIAVNLSDDQEQVAKIVSKYNLLAVPVVDDDQRLMGIVTVDDIIDVIEEEATEDILKFAGTSDIDSFEEERFLHRIFNSVRARLPWLIVTIFGGLLSAQVISYYQGAIKANTVIALFMPLLAGMGGNVGTQSSTLTVRGLALGSIEMDDVTKVFFQELLVGLIVGLVCACVVGAAALFLQGDMELGLIVAIAMWLNIITAAIIGTLVPLVFKKVGVDPAVASAPFISTTIDITGLSIYFALATVMMTKWAN